MTIAFAPLTRPGIPRLLELMEQLYSQDGLGYNEKRARKAIDGLLHEPAHGAIWLIHPHDEAIDGAIDGAIDAAIGYLILTLGYSLEFHGRYALLDEFYVDAEWRSRGIGGRALAFAEEWCRRRGLRALRLEVSHENPRALGLYQRTGFEVHDRHLMTKWL